MVNGYPDVPASVSFSDKKACATQACGERLGRGMTNMRSGGRILVDQLVAQGCDRIFTVPGESFLAVLDALHDTPEIDLVVRAGRRAASGSWRAPMVR